MGILENKWEFMQINGKFQFIKWEFPFNKWENKWEFPFNKWEICREMLMGNLLCMVFCKHPQNYDWNHKKTIRFFTIRHMGSRQVGKPSKPLGIWWFGGAPGPGNPAEIPPCVS